MRDLLKKLNLKLTRLIFRQVRSTWCSYTLQSLVLIQLLLPVAAQCINDQGKFWNLYDILFKNQGAEDSGWANKDNLKKFALQLPGLNQQKFNTCLDSGKNVSLVQNDLAFGTSLKVPETPAFIIEKSDGSNLEYLPGAFPFPAFQALINKELTGG